MNNLEVIKYLATNDPDRLIELLDDIYTIGWNNGAYSSTTSTLSETEINFDTWAEEEASESGLYNDEELEKWTELIKGSSEESEPALESTPLETSKRIVKKFIKSADCGIFNTENTVGDKMELLYEDENLKITICPRYAYFEVFGLSEEDFKELENYYYNITRGGQKECCTQLPQ